MSEMTLLGAVTTALREEMERDDNVVLLGEDIGVNGGVFRATEGLHAQFGDDRVIDTPLAESGIVGTAVGMALHGLKPVPEIQFCVEPRLHQAVVVVGVAAPDPPVQLTVALEQIPTRIAKRSAQTAFIHRAIRGPPPLSRNRLAWIRFQTAS